MDRQEAMRFAEKIGLGWNLGNTFDAPMGETSWHNPVTTREMILKIHSLGFKTLRLPVSWHRHMDENFGIDAEWLDRVNEVVDYAYGDGMYVILNTHHDDICFQPTAEGFEHGKSYLRALWSQLTSRFEGYGERLIFEAMNEPRILRSKYEWKLDFSEKVCLDALEYVNKYNQVFVNTVRAGEKGEPRLLMTPSYDAAPHHAYIPEFRVANDPADRLIVSVHSYEPIDLCLTPKQDIREFNAEGEKIIDSFTQKLYDRFIANGIPVIIGEMGIWDKNNPDDRYRWAKYFVRRARECKIACCWWDNGGREYKLFDRENLRVCECAEPVMRGLFEGLNSE